LNAGKWVENVNMFPLSRHLKAGRFGGMTATSNTPPSLQDIDLLHQHLTVLATLPENDDPLLSIHLDLSSSLDALRSKFSIWCAAAVIATPAPKRDWRIQNVRE
jgi:hypothetical protein